MSITHAAAVYPLHSSVTRQPSHVSDRRPSRAEVGAHGGLAPPNAGNAHTMATTTSHFAATPERVFSVLSDPRSYEYWVVGSKEIRHWDSGFPALGTSFHHTFLIGPLPVRDSTTVLEVDPPRRLKLRARARPTGVAHVTLDLLPRDGGTEVSITEVPVEGVAARLHNPLQDKLIQSRNVESLRRLKRLAERD